MFKRWGRLHYCFQEMEPFVLEPGKVLLTKLMESDRKTEVVLTKMELSATLEGFSIEVRQFCHCQLFHLLIPVVHSLVCQHSSTPAHALLQLSDMKAFIFTRIFSLRLRVNPSCRIWKDCGQPSSRNP